MVIGKMQNYRILSWNSRLAVESTRRVLISYKELQYSYGSTSIRWMVHMLTLMELMRTYEQQLWSDAFD